MPIYRFRCDKCNSTFEKILKVNDRDKVIGCECGYFAKRMMSDTFNFKLKGNCWASDGYSKPKPKEKYNADSNYV